MIEPTTVAARATTGVLMTDRDADFTAYLEARQGRLLRTAYLLTGDQHQAEDLLAVVEQDDRQAVLRLGLDGTVERTTDFEELHELATSWFLAGRPHE
jgi:hypothetical protein